MPMLPGFLKLLSHSTEIGLPRIFVKIFLHKANLSRRDRPIGRFLETYGSMDAEALQNHRYERFRNM